MDIVTYSDALVVLQETQAGLTVKVDGWIIGKGENLEGETGLSGIAVLNQLH